MLKEQSRENPRVENLAVAGESRSALQLLLHLKKRLDIPAPQH
jgi:hypothetical protein